MWPCCVLVVDKKGKLSVSQSGLACNRLTDGQSEPLAVGGETQADRCVLFGGEEAGAWCVGVLGWW